MVCLFRLIMLFILIIRNKNYPKLTVIITSVNGHYKRIFMLSQPQARLLLPPLPDKTIHNNIVTKLSKSETDVRFIVRKIRSQLQPTHGRIDQAILFYNLYNDLYDEPISIRTASKIMECDYSKLAKRIKSSMNKHGRPCALSEAQESELIDLIHLYSLSNRPVTASFLRQYIFDNFHVAVSHSWHKRFIERHPEDIRMDVAVPQDQMRLQLPVEYAKKHVQNLIEFLEGVPTDLVINIDEVGFQRWADRKKKKVVVSQMIPQGGTFYSIKRSEKKISLVVSISMSGSSLVPLVISHRKTMDKELKESGIREGVDFKYAHQSSAFINTEIFNDYIRSVIFVYIDELRKKPEFENEPAVILCDNCSSHINDDILKDMAQRNIRIITFPPHSSHLFQPLDLVTFGGFKIFLKNNMRQKSNASQTDIITETIKALQMAIIPINNLSAFNRAGLKINTKTIPNRCEVDTKKLLHRIEEAMLRSTETKLDFNKFGFINKKYI